MKTNLSLVVIGLAFCLCACSQGTPKSNGTETPNPDTTPKYAGGTETTMQMKASDDTNTKQLYPDQIKATSDYVDVWNYPDQRKVAYVKYDLSGIHKGATIKKAMLHFWVYQIRDEGTVFFYTVHGQWSENSLTYNTQNNLSFEPLFSHFFHQQDDNVYIDLDVTDLVQSWVDGSVENNGISIQAPESPTPVRVEFHSKDALVNPSYLDITVNDTPAQ